MDRVFGRVTIYPLRSAMHGAINVWTKRWGYVCFKPPTYVYGRWWPWYFYLSPNATPWGATLILGRDRGMHADRRLARLRRVLWGHGYAIDEHDPQDAQSYLDSFVGDLPPDDTAPSVEGEREERYTLEEIDAALYDAHREWDASNMQSFSGLMVEHLRKVRTPTPAGSEPEEE